MNKFNIGFVLCLSLHLVQSDQRVLIGDIKVLTLYKGRHTQARRVSPIPHIKCIGGTAKCLYEPDVIHCYNRGSDGIDIQWECMTDLPKKYKLGKFDVLCEGYNNPDDPYILTGSCGLEYHLELVDNSSDVTTGGVLKTMAIIFFVILLIIVCVALCASTDETTGNQNTRTTESSNNQPDNKKNVIETKSCVLCNKSFVRNHDISRSNLEYTCDECIKRQNSTDNQPSIDTQRSINYGGTKRR